MTAETYGKGTTECSTVPNCCTHSLNQKLVFVFRSYSSRSRGNSFPTLLGSCVCKWVKRWNEFHISTRWEQYVDGSSLRWQEGYTHMLMDIRSDASLIQRCVVSHSPQICTDTPFSVILPALHSTVPPFCLIGPFIHPLSIRSTESNLHLDATSDFQLFLRSPPPYIMRSYLTRHL